MPRTTQQGRMEISKSSEERGKFSPSPDRATKHVVISSKNEHWAGRDLKQLWTSGPHGFHLPL